MKNRNERSRFRPNREMMGWLMGLGALSLIPIAGWIASRFDDRNLASTQEARSGSGVPRTPTQGANESARELLTPKSEKSGESAQRDLSSSDETGDETGSKKEREPASSSPRVRRPAPFEQGEILSSEESEPDANGNFTRVKVVRTSMKYPLVRIEEKLRRDFSSGEEQRLSGSAMVADHVIVRLEEGYSSEDLTQIASSIGASIRRYLPASNLYLVSFEGKDVHALDRILSQLMKSQAIRQPEPDYLVRLY